MCAVITVRVCVGWFRGKNAADPGRYTVNLVRPDFGKDIFRAAPVVLCGLCCEKRGRASSSSRRGFSSTGPFVKQCVVSWDAVLRRCHVDSCWFGQRTKQG